MGKITFLLKYISYLLKAKDEHSLHSPFVFELYTFAVKPRKRFYIFGKIESLRKSLLNSTRKIIIKDYGAGSVVNRSTERSIASIARYSEKPAHLAQLLFQIIEYLKPKTLLDLGTSLGITTIYQAAVNKKYSVITFEGCPETCNVARENFHKMQLKNIELVEGNIDDTLRPKLNQLPAIDYAFFDANHRYEPTIRYFETCLQKAHEDSIFIFDDIHWSEEMEKAWKEIKNHPKVMITIDLFFIGLVFFRTKQPKQHYVLKF